MSSFAILEGSLLARPFLRIAQVSSATIEGWLQSSVWIACTRFLNAFSKVGERYPALVTLCTTLLMLGIMALFCSQAVLETTYIGLLTWLLLGLTLLKWLITPVAQRLKFNVVDLLVFAFLASAIISTASSSYRHTSVYGLYKMLTFFAGYLIFRQVTPQDQPWFTRLLWVLVGLGVLEALVGFNQYIHHIQPLATWEDPSINSELKMTRIFGTLKPANPNLLAGFLVPCFAAGYGLAVKAFIDKKWLPMLTAKFGTFLILVALVLTGSRGAYLAISGMMLTTFAYYAHLLWCEPLFKDKHLWRRFWIAAFVGLLLVAGGALASSEKLQHRVASIFAFREDSSSSYRMNVYSSAFRMFKDNPIVGIGPGNGTFKLVYGLYMVPGYNALGSYSVPLEIAVEQGIIGLSVFVLLMLILGMRSLLMLYSTRPIQEKLTVGLLLTGIIGSLIYGVFDTIWYRPAVNLLFWFFVAVLGSQTETAVDESKALTNDTQTV